MKVASKIHQRLVVDALFGLEQEEFASVVASLSDCQLVDVHKSEVAQYGTRRRADISFVLCGIRVFSFEFLKIIFAVAQPFSLPEGIERLKLYLQHASPDELRFFCRNFLSFVDDIVLRSSTVNSSERNDEISIPFLSANALFILCSLLTTTSEQKGNESQQVQDIFKMFLSLNSFSRFFSAAKLNKEFWEDSVWSRKVKQVILQFLSFGSCSKS